MGAKRRRRRCESMPCITTRQHARHCVHLLRAPTVHRRRLRYDEIVVSTVGVGGIMYACLLDYVLMGPYGTYGPWRRRGLSRLARAELARCCSTAWPAA